jgi:hypothetical protein
MTEDGFEIVQNKKKTIPKLKSNISTIKFTYKTLQTVENKQSDVSKLLKLVEKKLYPQKF